MTDLLTVLPHFDARPYTHILPSLEKALISCADLLTLDATHIAKRAQVPPGEVKKLTDVLIDALNDDIAFGNPSDKDQDGQDDGPEKVSSQRNDALLKQWRISTLDDPLDDALNGGIHSGYLTEVTGERYASRK